MLLVVQPAPRVEQPQTRLSNTFLQLRKEPLVVTFLGRGCFCRLASPCISRLFSVCHGLYVRYVRYEGQRSTAWLQSSLAR